MLNIFLLIMLKINQVVWIWPPLQKWKQNKKWEFVCGEGCNRTLGWCGALEVRRERQPHPLSPTPQGWSLLAAWHSPSPCGGHSYNHNHFSHIPTSYTCFEILAFYILFHWGKRQNHDITEYLLYKKYKTNISILRMPTYDSTVLKIIRKL